MANMYGGASQSGLSVANTQPIQLPVASVISQTIQRWKGCENIVYILYINEWVNAEMNHASWNGREATEPYTVKLFFFSPQKKNLSGFPLALSFCYQFLFITIYLLSSSLPRTLPRMAEARQMKGSAEAEAVGQAVATTNSTPNWIQRGQTMYLHLLCFVLYIVLNNINILADNLVDGFILWFALLRFTAGQSTLPNHSISPGAFGRRFSHWLLLSLFSVENIFRRKAIKKVGILQWQWMVAWPPSPLAIRRRLFEKKIGESS